MNAYTNTHRNCDRPGVNFWRRMGISGRQVATSRTDIRNGELFLTTL